MLRSKLPETSLKTAIEIINIAEQNKAINLACSVPDFNMSTTLINSVEKHMRNGKNQYAPIEGIMPLREAVAQHFNNKFGVEYNPETEITVTAGATEAVWATISAIVHEDDEVIVLEPTYENYVPAIRMNGGMPVFVSLKHPDYKIDWNEVIRSVNQRTRMIIISNPHNPAGMVLNDEDLQRLQKIVAGNKIIVLSDETYASLVYDTPMISVAKYPVLAKQSVVINSLGKTFNATGWKTGICCAPAEYTSEIRRMHNYICNGSNAAIQYTFAELLSNPNCDEVEKIKETYRHKRDLLTSMLQGSKYNFIPSQGTWFQTVDCSAISSENDVDFSMRLVKNYGVAVFPMSLYYHDKNKNNVIRICFAREDDTLKKGIEQLLKVE
ncbi:MAG: methionine aminotransferase [Bacteroidales bacterium]|nr:methionine aminotransferase [Bacteroidales bacterium]